MTFFFIPWRPVISRFAQNAAHHSCSSVFKASMGCPIFPRLDAQTVDARKPSPTTTTGLLRMATKPVLISLGYLHCAPQAISESWIRYSRFGPLVAGTSQNAPPAVSESPRGIADKVVSLSLGQFYSQAGFERGKSATIARVYRASGGSFEPVSVSHPLNFKGKFRTATPAS